MQRFEVREIDAWLYDDEWIWNTSYLYGHFTTRSKNEARAFTRYLARHHGITFYKGRTRIEFDGDCFTILDRKTLEPLFVAIPCDN